MTASEHPSSDGIGDSPVELRWAASLGYLSAIADDPGIAAAAYELVLPLTFERHTRKLELHRGHHGCARSFTAMPADCLDRFHDDVIAVRDHLLRTTVPVARVEGYVVRRMPYAVIEGYRARRGSVGASHKGNVPDGLARLLDDPWLTELAHRMLIWVGIRITAGTAVWPIESWAELKALRLAGVPRNHGPSGVERDIERVVTIMQAYNPSWFARYIEGPLQHKPLPVAGEPADRSDPSTPTDDTEELLQDAAADAVEYVRAALTAGADPEDVVRRALKAFRERCRADSDGDVMVGLTPERIEELVPVLIAILAQDHG